MVLVTFLMVDLVIGEFKMKEFNAIFSYNDKQTYTISEGSSEVVADSILPTKVQHNTFLEIV
jgi:hypothetical protein